jgi:hypothetical protein
LTPYAIAKLAPSWRQTLCASGCVTKLNESIL